jgi:hypothetical protein
MSLKERNVALISSDADGNVCIDHPVTKLEQIEDLGAATSSALGLVKIGTNLSIRDDGTISVPTATSTNLGSVMIGDNITNSSGTISLTKSNVTSALGYTPPTSAGGGIPYATCSTATDTAAKVATTVSGTFSLSTGQACIVYFSNRVADESEAWTLNINSTGAKNVQFIPYSGGTLSSSGTYSNARIPWSRHFLIVYNGSAYLLIADGFRQNYYDYGDAG